MKFTTAAIVAAAAAPALAIPLAPASNSSNTCSAASKEILSCSAQAEASDVDGCCVETAGGLLSLTQFWDTHGATPLPKNSWTLHGLWPDNCDGSFEQSCDQHRRFNSVKPMLEKAGRDDLVEYMNNYWINGMGTNDHFWAHEYSKHATCYSTFQPKCYSDYTPESNMVDFFETAIAAFKEVPTYDWLAKHDIVPSSTKTYSLDQIQSALKAEYGAIPFIGCHGSHGKTVVNQVWYYRHQHGRPQDGKWTPVDSTAHSNCPKGENSIHYPERK